jgi:hypothetical protein
MPPAAPAAHSFGAFEDAEEERDIIQQCVFDDFVDKCEYYIMFTI